MTSTNPIDLDADEIDPEALMDTTQQQHKQHKQHSVSVQMPFPYRQHSSMEGHKGAVTVVRFNSDGQYVMSGGKDRAVMLWNPHKGIRVKEYAGVHGYEVLGLCVRNDNLQFVSCGADRAVFSWDVATGQVVKRYNGHTQRVNAVQYGPEGNTIISGSYDGTVRCWDCRSNRRDPIQKIDSFTDSVTSLQVTQHEIVAVSVDGCIRTFDVRAGKLVTDHIAQAMTSIRLTSDKYCALVSCLDNTIRLMDRKTGGLLNQFVGHKHATYAVESCLTNDDAYVVSGSEDGKIYIWNLLDGALAHSLIAHSKEVVSVDYHPSETRMVSASADGVIKCWTT